MKKTGNLKPHSTPATLMWLDANYEPVDGVCIPRNALYKQYTDFCGCHNLQPVNAASFGKIIRQKFPKLTTRRLGTRGKSRYHYYGIAVKPGSVFYNQVHQYCYGTPYFKCDSKLPSYKRRVSLLYPILLLNPRELKMNFSLQNQQCSLQPTFASSLFKFPTSEILATLPSYIPKTSTENILVMYTLHCNQMIEYAVNLRCLEFQNCVVHFWNNFPEHLSGLLKTNSVLSLIGICDSIMYKTICQSGIPILSQEDVPTHKACHYVKLAENNISWILHCSPHLPSALRKMKLHLSIMFVQSMKRSSSINQMTHSLRQYLSEKNHSKEMLKDWESVDLRGVIQDVTLAFGLDRSQPVISHISKYCKELESLIRRQARMNEYSAWITDIVNQSIGKLSTQTPMSPFESLQSIKNPGCGFVLIWTSLGTRLLREFTLLEAKTFGTFHLLYLMVSDHGAQVMEGFTLEERIQRLTTNVSVGEPPEAKDHNIIGFYCDDDCPCKTGVRRPGSRNTDGNIIPIQVFQSTAVTQPPSGPDSLMASGFPAKGSNFPTSPVMTPGVTTLVSTHTPPIYCALPLNSPLTVNTDLPSYGFGHAKPFAFQHTQYCHAYPITTAGGVSGTFGVARDTFQSPSNGSSTSWSATGVGHYEHQTLLRPCQHYLEPEQPYQSTSYNPPSLFSGNFFDTAGQLGECNLREDFLPPTTNFGPVPDGNFFRIDTNLSIGSPQQFPHTVIAMATATATVAAPLDPTETDVEFGEMNLNEPEIHIPQPNIFVPSPGSLANQMGSSSFYISTNTGPCSPYQGRK